MPFHESSRGHSDPRPETYNQYKQEAGADLKVKDLAAYFNGDMHVVTMGASILKDQVEKSTSLLPEEKEKMLKRLSAMAEKLEEIQLITKDALQALWKKEQGNDPLDG
jgi:hypothetical protein